MMSLYHLVLRSNTKSYCSATTSVTVSQNITLNLAMAFGIAHTQNPYTEE